MKSRGRAAAARGGRARGAPRIDMLLVLAKMDSEGQFRVPGAQTQQVGMSAYDPDQFGTTGTQ